MREELVTALSSLDSARRSVVAECGTIRERRRRRENVLVVEDEPSNARVTELMLRDTADIIIARSAEEAIEIFGDNPVAIVIVDLTLPGMSGVDLADRLRPSIVIYSGDTPEHIADAARATHADAWLQKDGDGAALRAVVKRLLADRAAR